jgi:hypothetical protein
MVTFPSHHGTYIDMPDEWAATLRSVLHRAKEPTNETNTDGQGRYSHPIDNTEPRYHPDRGDTFNEEKGTNITIDCSAPHSST